MDALILFETILECDRKRDVLQSELLAKLRQYVSENYHERGSTETCYMVTDGARVLFSFVCCDHTLDPDIPDDTAIDMLGGWIEDATLLWGNEIE
jgi:hypothetical protein